MKPGDRIALITESARLLASREEPEIDLVLGQHGFQTRYNDNDTLYGYVIQMIENAPDLELADLHSYLVGESDDSPSADAQMWTPGRFRLFISHLATHQEFVGQVSAELGFGGISAFVAHTSIEPSLEWQAVIETALRSCDAMAVFLHPGFHESNWCDQEVGFALSRRVPVLPVALGLMPYGFMSKFQALKAEHVPPSVIADNIANWLVSVPTAQEPITEALVEALTQSTGYDRTRQILGLLEKLPRFTPAQLDRMDNAPRTNSQVRDAGHGTVPGQIKALIARHGGTTASQVFSDEPPF